MAASRPLASPPRERTVVHVDLDAFFVAVERVREPRLRGRPVVVGGAPEERGVVAAASYEARRHGIHSAMPMARALRLCPDLVRVPPSPELYRRASRAVFAILRHYTPVVEPVSVDEDYLDLTGTGLLFGRAVDAAEGLRREVRERLGLDATVGISRNRLVSKVASAFAKPCGLFDVRPGQEPRFLAPLPVVRLPGIGPVTERRLRDLNIPRLGLLAATPDWFLEEVFGACGPAMQSRARGEDDTPVSPPWERPEAKSIGHEETFPRDTDDHTFLRARLQDLLGRAAARLRAKGLLARRLTVHLRYADFVDETRDTTLPRPTDHDVELLEPALALLHRMAVRRTLVRLLGVRLSGLTRGFWQAGLWEEQRARERRLLVTLDRVRAKYGRRAVASGASVLLLPGGRSAASMENHASVPHLPVAGGHHYGRRTCSGPAQARRPGAGDRGPGLVQRAAGPQPGRAPGTGGVPGVLGHVVRSVPPHGAAPR